MTDHQIKKALGILPEVSMDEDSPKMDTNTIIVHEYIQRYAPADAYGPGVIIQTTADIINDLADMADLDHDEVNAVLIRGGVSPGTQQFRFLRMDDACTWPSCRIR